MVMPFATVLFPAWRRDAPDERRAALHEARNVSLDIVELLGIAAGLVVSLLVVRYAASSWLASFPVLAVAVGPFLLRRTRRGLRRHLARRQR
jgi:hypothetical protein